MVHFGKYEDTIVLVIWRELCDKILQRYLITITSGSIKSGRGLCLFFFLVQFCQGTFSSVLHVGLLDTWPSEVPGPTVYTI